MIKVIFKIINFLKKIILFLLLTLLTIFMVNNRQAVIINSWPFPFEIETRLFIIMMLFFTAGLLFGFLFFSKNLLKLMFSKSSSDRVFKKSRKINK